MAVTLTLTSGPSAHGPDQMMATYTALLDTTHLTAGEAIDLTGEFTYIHYAACGGNDTAADNGYKFDIVHPGAGTAISSTTVLLTAFWSNNTAQVFASAGGEDLSGVAELQIMVIGS